MFHSFTNSINSSSWIMTNALLTLLCLRLAMTSGIARPDFFLRFIQLSLSSTASCIQGPGLKPFSFFASTMKYFLLAKNHRSPSSYEPERRNLSASRSNDLKYSTRSVSHWDPLRLFALDCFVSTPINQSRSYICSTLCISVCNLYSRWIDEKGCILSAIGRMFSESVLYCCHF